MAIRIQRARALIRLSFLTASFSSASHPIITSSTSSVLPPLAGNDELAVSKAVSILLWHRSKRRWSHLRSLFHPAGFSATQFSHITLRLRNHPHLVLRLFAFTRRHSLCRHDHLSFASAAHVLARHRHRSAALSLLVEAIRFLELSSSDDPLPDIFRTLVKTYRTFESAPFVFDLLIRAYLDTKRLDRAVQIVRTLISRGIQPLISTANSLIQSFSRAKGSDAGFEIYREIFRPEAFNGGDGVSVRVSVSPTVGTFNALLLAFCREEKLERFEEIREEMENFGCEPNVFTFSVLMAGFCDAGMIEKSRELWEEMLSKGIKPDIMAFNTLIGGYSDVAEMERAEELYKEMVLREIAPTIITFEHLVRGHCKVGDVDSGLLLYGDARRRGFRMEVAVVDELLEKMCKKGMVAEGLIILKDEMRREGFMPSQRSYEVLIRGFCEEGAIEEAVKLQAEMAGKGFGNSLEVYTAFIQGYEKQGDVNKVERLKDEMRETGLQCEWDWAISEL